jgi:hypothetical protein
MINGDGLLRVFWPNDIPRSSSPGVIIGWRNSDLDLFVITVLEDVEVCEVLVTEKGLLTMLTYDVSKAQKCR